MMTRDLVNRNVCSQLIFFVDLLFKIVLAVLALFNNNNLKIIVFGLRSEDIII